MKTLHILVIFVSLAFGLFEIAHAQYGLPPSEQSTHSAVLQQALTQVENEKTVTVNDTNFTLNYTITGNDNKIAKINLDTAGEGLVIFMNAHSDGNFTITLPRELIDAKINGTDTTFTYHEVGGDITALVTDKKSTPIDRTITIYFGAGNRVIDLMGSHAVPEFPLAVPVLLMGIISLIVFYKMKIHI
ncbi:MAG: hypothetical protein KGL95_10365 [Patescibacteria group bacterium]|nr:hypothetical protein [Patescibacteria group bacterium]